MNTIKRFIAERPIMTGFVLGAASYAVLAWFL